jgi:hypothetical protein
MADRHRHEYDPSGLLWLARALSEIELPDSTGPAPDRRAPSVERKPPEKAARGEAEGGDASEPGNRIGPAPLSSHGIA